MLNLFAQLWKTIKDFPLYISAYTVGLVIAVLRDVHITTLTITGVVLGLALGSIVWGFAVFFIGYSITRIVSNLTDAIGFGLRDIARATTRENNIANLDSDHISYS